MSHPCLHNIDNMYIHENICQTLTNTKGKGGVIPIDTNTTKVIKSTCKKVCFLVPPSRLRLSPSPQMPVNDRISVSFNCTSERAYPLPTFEWYKNDKLIQRYEYVVHFVTFCLLGF